MYTRRAVSPKQPTQNTLSDVRWTLGVTNSLSQCDPTNQERLHSHSLLSGVSLVSGVSLENSLQISSMLFADLETMRLLCVCVGEGGVQTCLRVYVCGGGGARVCIRGGGGGGGGGRSRTGAQNFTGVSPHILLSHLKFVPWENSDRFYSGKAG